MARGFDTFVVDFLLFFLVFFFLADFLCFFIAMTLPWALSVDVKAA
jgi:hypothetical protein